MRVSVESGLGRYIGGRKEQQDRVAVLTHPTHAGALLAVLADGMGGHSGGAMAAEHVIASAQQNLEAFSPATETPDQLLISVIRDANAAIRASKFSSEQDPHSTVVVFLLYRGKVYWAHCGDSRLYHFRNGEKMSRTRDHSLVGELQRRGKITEEEALHHPQRNVLVSCLGGDRAPTVEHARCESVGAGDHFLLCSDGLWGYFSERELGSMIAFYPIGEAIERLLTMTKDRSRGGGDNVSFAIIKFVPPREKRTNTQ